MKRGQLTHCVWPMLSRKLTLQALRRCSKSCLWYFVTVYPVFTTQFRVWSRLLPFEEIDQSVEKLLSCTKQRFFTALYIMWFRIFQIKTKINLFRCSSERFSSFAIRPKVNQLWYRRKPFKEKTFGHFLKNKLSS